MHNLLLSKLNSNFDHLDHTNSTSLHSHEPLFSFSDSSPLRFNLNPVVGRPWRQSPASKRCWSSWGTTDSPTPNRLSWRTCSTSPSSGRPISRGSSSRCSPRLRLWRFRRRCGGEGRLSKEALVVIRATVPLRRSSSAWFPPPLICVLRVLCPFRFQSLVCFPAVSG